MNTQQPKALRLADALDIGGPRMISDCFEAAAELRRLHQHDLATAVWSEKTEWVQTDAQPGELGMHRADVLKQRIEHLQAVNAEMLAALQYLSALHPRRCNLAEVTRARAAIAKATGGEA